MSERRLMVWSRLVAAIAIVGVMAVVAMSAMAASSGGARLSVHSSEFGKAVFGPSGKVVYVFGADHGSVSRCYGVCAAAWPPLLTTGATKRKNGSVQVTYNGHPLYYYSADKVGKVMCQHANMHGGLWLIIKPNGQPNMAQGKMHM